MSPVRKSKKKTASAAPARALPTVAFATPREWAAWLAAHHESSSGVWLKLGKKAAGTASVTYPEALEAALAWGWIDGLKRAHDAHSWLQKFTPRGARSGWSKINREKALALIAAGKMKPPGLKEVQRARHDGRWAAAYDSQSTAAVPADLAAALAGNPRAKAFFETLESHNRYAVLYRVQTAKLAATRARRIAEFVAMLAKHQTLHPQRR